MFLFFLHWRVEKQKKQTNSFIRFLVESTARRSAFGIIWPLGTIHLRSQQILETPPPPVGNFLLLPVSKFGKFLTAHSPLKNANFDGPLSKVINYWSIYLKITTLWEGHKILKDLPLGFTRQLFLPNSVKTNGRFFQIFVAISGKLNFKIIRICTCVIRPVCDSFKPWFFIQSGLFKERIQFYLIK